MEQWRCVHFVATIILFAMKVLAQVQVPVRIISHNVRYATTSPFKGEKPWAERRQVSYVSCKEYIICPVL
jgi:hypothetical protein